MTRADDVPVPWWAARARTVFRVVMGLWAFLIILRLVLLVVLSVLDRRVDVPRWVEAPLLAILVAGLAAGVVWLVGAAVRGYRSD